MKYIITYAGLPIRVYTNACGKHYSAVAQDAAATRFDSKAEAEVKADLHRVPARHRTIQPFDES